MTTQERNPATQYVDDANLAARQRFWVATRREPAFDLFAWVLDVAGLDGSSVADVLDVGCGNGAYERSLAERGHTGLVAALDLSFGMLAGLDGVRVQADVQALPFAGGRFDVVLAPHMLYHVPDVARAALECRRVLRPGGTFVAVTNGEANLEGLRHLVEGAVGTGWRMRRPAEDAFSLENGGEQLAGAFDRVDRVDAPATEVLVDDAELLAGYVASVADHYEAQVDVPWSTVVARVREQAAGEISRDGAISWQTSMGAFVCR